MAEVVLNIFSIIMWAKEFNYSESLFASHRCVVLNLHVRKKHVCLGIGSKGLKTVKLQLTCQN